MSPQLNQFRVRTGAYASDDSDGFNGMFSFIIEYFKTNGAKDRDRVLVIAGDGLGWEHVSVSLPDHPITCPRWELMCAVKEMFWGEEATVVQFHPPKSDYVNNHPGCLHLWRPLETSLPLPPSFMVGFKDTP